MKTKRNAFSLIEILVVIIIVSVLAAIAHTAFLSYVMRGKIAEAMQILDEYQSYAITLRNRKGTITPYDLLFPDGDETGWISGTTSSTSASKELNIKYVDTISAYTGTSGSDTYILMGVGLQHDGVIISGADHLYLVGIITPAGEITWKCGTSASHSDTVPADYLPQTCINSLP
jgi:prepilin-type N-terminal cleavage/methylation domain-containing protein